MLLQRSGPSTTQLDHVSELFVARLLTMSGTVLDTGRGSIGAMVPLHNTDRVPRSRKLAGAYFCCGTPPSVGTRTTRGCPVV